MPSIYTTAQPIYGRVQIFVNFTDTTDTHVTVYRVLDGQTTGVQVRVHTISDATGWAIELSGGLATLYDTEAPLDVPLWYYAVGSTSLSQALATLPGDVLGSGENFWLKAPLRPWADQRVVLNYPQLDPRCVPAGALYFISMDVENRANRSVVQVVNNRRNPIALTKQRGGIASSLVLVSRTFEDRDHVITLNDKGDPLQFQGAAQYGIPDQYMSVGDYQVGRLITDHKKPWRVNTMPYTQVDRPAGLADGVRGSRWRDTCLPYATFAAATAAEVTWSQVLAGQATLNPSPTAPAWTYGLLATTYATYTALNAAYTTYEAVAQGPF